MPAARSPRNPREGSLARRTTPTLLALIALAVPAGMAAYGKAPDEKKGSKKEAEVIATVNGEPVTAGEWGAIWKADKWHAPVLKTKPGYAEQMAGKPYEDYFFREEIVKIRAMSQKYGAVLPAMRASIEAILEKARAGEDFAELARQYSQDQGSAAAGGDLGLKEFEDLVFPFNRVAFDMEIGEISEPVLTIFGYHLIKVDRIEPASEGKGKQVSVRNILVRYPSTEPREESEQLADEADVEVLDKKLCKKLVTYCTRES